jgi:adenosylmethionine-8-amino-7-oxononanoate aminotransferase
MTVPSWIESDRRFCWHPWTQHGSDPDPLPVVGARGPMLRLADGRMVIDAISSWWCCLHGHGHPRLVNALARQAESLDHVLFAGCTHEPAALLAARLVSLAPPGLTRVFFSDDGSTAVEVALKAAYLAHRRRRGGRARIVALEGAYHGDTFGAMSAGDPDPFFREAAPLLFPVERIPARAAALESLDPEDAAALVVEPIVQGAAGMRPVPAEFLRAARRWCDAHGAFLVADEVMTGFGRTGTLFACEQAGVAPDVLCLAKGLAGGLLPLAATLFTEEIHSAFLDRRRERALFHGHTFTANPIACAVALESLAIVGEEETPRRLGEIGARIERGLSDLRRRKGVLDLRRFGGIVAVELSGGEGYLSPAGERLRAACRERAPDVLLRPLGNVLYAMPPSCAGPDECDRIAGAMSSVVDALGAAAAR